VLAAGTGARFRASSGKTHKLDTLLHSVPVLQYVLRAVEDSGLAVYVVRPATLGEAATDVAGFCTDGMGDSIASGVRATANSPGWLILPGDLPLITSATLQRIAQALERHPIVVPHHRGCQGHPVGFQAECRSSLEALSGDRGATQVVRAYRAQDQVMDLAVDDVGVITDIDTLDDLANVSASINNTSIEEATGKTGRMSHGHD
jgi:molybdenum cofactor cytidylyltransferase